MTSSISFGGLASGLDTDAIIEALVGVKTAQLITPLENRIVEITDDQTALSTISTSLSSMQSATKSLNEIRDFDGRTATSSDSTELSVSTVTATASKGTYSVVINALAQADRNYFTGVANTTAEQFGTGTITLSSGGSTFTVDIDSTNNTLEGIRDAINAEAGTVTASIVDDGSATNQYRLVLTSTSTGADSDITQDIAAVLTTGTPALANDAALNADASNIGQDASIVVNGLTVTQSSNTISSVIPGVTFSLLQLHTDAASPIKVTVSGDFTATETAIANFINSYNEVLSKFKDAFDVDTSTGMSTGTLSSDFALQSSENRLTSLMISIQSQLAGNTYQSLSQIGITMDDNSYLVIDTAKLETAMSTDLTSVQRLFQGMSTTNDGIADKAYDLLYSLTNAADGLLTQKDRIWQENINDLSEQIDVRQARIDAYEARLKAKFVYMEQVISQLNDMSSSLESSTSVLDNVNQQASGG